RGIFTPPRRNNPEKLQEAINLIATYGIDKTLKLYTDELERAEQTWISVRDNLRAMINALVEPPKY
ncbi:TPA: SWIM zinc finger family protein, partial [Escherichia coli]